MAKIVNNLQTILHALIRDGGDTVVAAQLVDAVNHPINPLSPACRSSVYRATDKLKAKGYIEEVEREMAYGAELKGQQVKEKPLRETELGAQVFKGALQRAFYKAIETPSFNSPQLAFGMFSLSIDPKYIAELIPRMRSELEKCRNIADTYQVQYDEFMSISSPSPSIRYQAEMARSGAVYYNDKVANFTFQIAELEAQL